MPERSRIRPMKVKNGIASSVSFCMMPKMRSGSACSRRWRAASRARRRSSRRTGRRPPSEKATEKPIKQEDDQPREHDRGHVGDDEFDHCLTASAVCLALASTNSASSSSAVFCAPSCLVGSSIRPLQEGDALDQLGHALQQQQREAHRHHREHRPANQAAGVGRHLAGDVGLDHQRPDQADDVDAEREQEQHDADDLDLDLRAPGEAAQDDVDRTCSWRSMV